jgi:hypothetical protein
MRATINFEVDIDRVQQTMVALVWEELQPLHQAMDALETSSPQDLHDGISKALEILGSVAAQLEQYRDMITSFEKARLETMVPQPAPPPNLITNLAQVKKATEAMEQFDDFVGTMREESDDDPTEG